MCGRYALKGKEGRIMRQFELYEIPRLIRRFNIAPSQAVPIVRLTPEGQRECVLVRWGLLPSWAKEPKIDYSTINARAETVATKPAFRNAFRRRRCLVPASGYFEWAARPGSKTKQPYFISLREGELFAFAGLSEHWEREGTVIESCTIIVTEANDLTRPIHDRMPVILGERDYALWLSADARQAELLQSLLKPFPSELMQTYPVSTEVNNPRNDTERCVQKVLPA
ncbi:SOS response-associated peptidase [Methylocaldum sp. 14B]|uniref:SOS response-associated peptidase n=1 Tax=Methylocaldum sp. 14B TaxID=1912213 RepID=UPI00098AC8B8|nr:SOS response-associated peptidase [Methylocaldum sp. 14B]